MTQASFAKKVITTSITLGKGDFGAVSDFQNTKVISGLRTVVEIEKNGHPSKNKAKIKIYGMSERDMHVIAHNQFGPRAIRRDLIQLNAGDETMLHPPKIFEGEINEAYASYQSPPNLYLCIEATAGYYPALAPANPRSLQGSVSVKDLMNSYAKQMGYTFEDNGVTARLANPYFPGSAYQQASALADAANIEFGIDDGVLFIAPRDKPRRGTAPLICALSGMKECPIYEKTGLRIETLFNPAIVLGGLIVVKSLVFNNNMAETTWRVHGLQHHLESENPGGKWMTSIKAASLSAPAVDESGGAE